VEVCQVAKSLEMVFRSARFSLYFALDGQTAVLKGRNKKEEGR
jgi:hypothetical protein